MIQTNVKSTMDTGKLKTLLQFRLEKCAFEASL